MVINCVIPPYSYSLVLGCIRGFPGGGSLVVRNLPAKAGDIKRCGFDLWVGKISWRRAWQLTPVFLPGESHGQRSLAGYSPWGRKEPVTTEWLSTCKWYHKVLLVLLSIYSHLKKNSNSKSYLKRIEHFIGALRKKKKLKGNRIVTKRKNTPFLPSLLS